MFENKVLRRKYGPKRDEVMEGWRKLHNEELYNLYSSPNISQGESDGQVMYHECGEEQCIEDIGGKVRKRDHKENQDVGGWIILKRILERE
jgi:hypothetical protein